MTADFPEDAKLRINSIMKTANGVDDYLNIYKKWSCDGQYDKDVALSDHQGSQMMADQVEAIYPDGRAEVYILDVGAGTGRAAVELRKRNFVKIDALDPSEEMLNVARENNLYQKYINGLIDDKPLRISQGTYDAVVCVGAICPGHLPACSIKEMLRLTRTGGIVVVAGSGAEWERLPEYSVKMTALIKDLEKRGKVRVVRMGMKPGYMYRNTPASINGMVVTLQKL